MELTRTQLLELKMGADDVQTAIREYIAARSGEMNIEPANCQDATIKWSVSHNPSGNTVRFNGAIVNIRA